MSPSKSALDSWKRADADARIAEARLLAVWELYEKGLVNGPDEALLREVGRLRGVANEKLMAAMVTLAMSVSAAPAARRDTDTV